MLLKAASIPQSLSEKIILSEKGLFMLSHWFLFIPWHTEQSKRPLEGKGQHGNEAWNFQIWDKHFFIAQ